MFEDIFLLLLFMVPLIGTILLADCIANLSYYARRRRNRKRRAKAAPKRTTRVLYIVDGDHVRFPAAKDETA